MRAKHEVFGLTGNESSFSRSEVEDVDGVHPWVVEAGCAAGDVASEAGSIVA